MIAVILAGGGGTRLWPVSRRNRPKQFARLLGEETLIRDAYRRLLRWLPAENVYFSVSPEFAPLLQAEFPEVPAERIFIEPEKRDTGPAMGYAAALLERTHPDEPLVFVPSDHDIKDEERFLTTLAVGERLVRETGKLVDIGIEPEFPNTALGYTKVGERYGTFDGVEAFVFAGHSEKPDLETAKRYLVEGSYLWHANYYMWTPRAFMAAFARYAPDMHATLRAIQQGDIARYAALPRISIDYAVAEKLPAGGMLVLKGEFGWSDVGAWDALHARLEGDGDGNVARGQGILEDSRRSFVYGPADKLIAVVGLDDIVVVDDGDALLVCHRDRAQDVKGLVERLEKEGYDAHL